jgi:hypothetical protein
LDGRIHNTIGIYVVCPLFEKLRGVASFPKTEFYH